MAIRIDHIGSTSVPGLASKPIIDIQISARSLDPVDAFELPLDALGYTLDTGNRDRTKLFFAGRQSLPWTNIHIRVAGS